MRHGTHSAPPQRDRRPRERRRRDERGTATAFVVGSTVTLLAVAGLVVDAGTALNARMKLADDTEQAARAGAQQIDLLAIRGAPGEITLDQGRAEAAAREYINRFGYDGTNVRVVGDEVFVAAEDTVSTRLLSLVNFNQFTIDASSTASPETQ